MIAAAPRHASLAMLPKPSLTFTVPSLHDGLPIDCRIYHPHALAAPSDAPAWRRHAAVVAHPYAPLGGCYDDPIVDIVAGTLLRTGFLVGTFNFRFVRSPCHIIACFPTCLSAALMFVLPPEVPRALQAGPPGRPRLNEPITCQ